MASAATMSAAASSRLLTSTSISCKACNDRLLVLNPAAPGLHLHRRHSQSAGQEQCSVLPWPCQVNSALLVVLVDQVRFKFRIMKSRFLSGRKDSFSVRPALRSACNVTKPCYTMIEVVEESRVNLAHVDTQQVMSQGGHFLRFVSSCLILSVECNACCRTLSRIVMARKFPRN